MTTTERSRLVEVLTAEFGSKYTPSQINAGVDEVIADRRAAMTSHTYVELDEISKPDGYAIVVAQSCYSGFRVELTLSRGPMFPCSCMAKTSEIPRLRDPGCPTPRRFGDPPVWRYARLGIGSGLYVAAMAKLDDFTGADCRCVDHAGTEFAAAARWKLHRQDPWKWEYQDCRICRSHGVDDWSIAQRDTYVGINHAGAEYRPADRWAN